MKPDEVAKSYDQIADVWNSKEFPCTDGIRQHERAAVLIPPTSFTQGK